MKDIGKYRCRVNVVAENVLQRQKFMVEQFLSAAIHQPGILVQNSTNMFNRLCAVTQEGVQEYQHFFHIGKQLFFGLCQVAAFDRSGNAVANKYQQRLFNVEFAQLVRLNLKQLHLLIEGQQTADQIKVPLFRINGILQIIDAVIFSVAIVVEILVGVVHDDGFSVSLYQGTLVLGFLGIAGGIDIQRLLEGCRVLKRKSLCRKACAIFVPHITGQTAVAFVHQHQVVLLKAIDGDSLYFTFFLQLVHVDHDNIIAAGS